MTIEGDLLDFLGMKIFRSKEKKAFELTQSHLIQGIIKVLRLEREHVKTKITPGPSS
jgi:hypothetical protein